MLRFKRRIGAASPMRGNGIPMAKHGSGNGKPFDMGSVLKAVARGLAEQSAPLLRVELDNQTSHPLEADNVTWRLVDGQVHLRLTIRERP